jgi:hypothetical protein
MVFHELRDVFVNPEPTLKKLANKPTKLGALNVPLILGAISLISGIIIHSKITLSFSGTSPLPNIDSVFLFIQIIVLVILPSIEPVFSFFINAGIIHLISVHMIGAKGKFDRILVMVGYSYTPRLISAVLLLVAALFSQPVSGNISLSDLELGSQQTVVILLSYLQQAPILFVGYLQFVLLFWSIFLMALSSRIEYKHEWIPAILTVVIPALSLLIFLI